MSHNKGERKRKTKYRYCPFCKKETVTQKQKIGIDYVVLCCTCAHIWTIESGIIMRLKNKQEIDAVLCAFLYFYNNATGDNYKLKTIAELHSELMEIARVNEGDNHG